MCMLCQSPPASFGFHNSLTIASNTTCSESPFHVCRARNETRVVAAHRHEFTTTQQAKSLVFLTYTSVFCAQELGNKSIVTSAPINLYQCQQTREYYSAFV